MRASPHGPLEFWTELAQLLEYGTFDAAFLADVIGAFDAFRGGPETALRETVQIPSNDPLLVIPAMAQVTKNLGFGATFSTTYEPPFAFARRASTLDHLTKGRFAWNIVTSYLLNAARNFGRDGDVPRDHRYKIADEYLVAGTPTVLPTPSQNGSTTTSTASTWSNTIPSTPRGTLSSSSSQNCAAADVSASRTTTAKPYVNASSAQATRAFPKTISAPATAISPP